MMNRKAVIKINGKEHIFDIKYINKNNLYEYMTLPPCIKHGILFQNSVVEEVVLKIIEYFQMWECATIEYWEVI
jgi:hypothetical protein